MQHYVTENAVGLDDYGWKVCWRDLEFVEKCNSRNSEEEQQWVEFWRTVQVNGDKFWKVVYSWSITVNYAWIKASLMVISDVNFPTIFVEMPIQWCYTNMEKDFIPA